jgi:hypothetical protein
MNEVNPSLRLKADRLRLKMNIVYICLKIKTVHLSKMNAEYIRLQIKAGYICLTMKVESIHMTMCV